MLKVTAFIALVLGICFVASQPLQAQYKYYISGGLTNGAGRTLYLSPDVYIANNDKQIIDSVRVTDRDSFYLSGNAAYAGKYSLFLRDQKSFIVFFLDTAHVYIKADTTSIYKAAVRGSIEQDLLKRYNAVWWGTQSALESAFNKLMALNRQTPLDTLQFRQSKALVDSLNKRSRNITDSFMAAHPQSYVTLENLLPNEKDTAAYATADFYIRNMPVKYVRNPMYQRIVKLVAAQKAIRVGAIVPEVAQADTTRKKMINSKQLLKKHDYLLLDFWASWCGPCRANNPELKALYAKYKGPRFEIVGISLDNNLSNWKKAIIEEGTTWPNMSDLQGFDNKYALEFNIRAIPAYLLLDKQGKLLLKTSKIDELKAKLEELL